MQNALYFPDQNAQFYELDEDETAQVSGGMIWIPVAAYIAALNGAHSFGESVGRAMYNAMR